MTVVGSVVLLAGTALSVLSAFGVWRFSIRDLSHACRNQIRVTRPGPGGPRFGVGGVVARDRRNRRVDLGLCCSSPPRSRDISSAGSSYLTGAHRYRFDALAGLSTDCSEPRPRREVRLLDPQVDRVDRVLGAAVARPLRGLHRVGGCGRPRGRTEPQERVRTRSGSKTSSLSPASRCSIWLRWHAPMHGSPGRGPRRSTMTSTRPSLAYRYRSPPHRLRSSWPMP